MVPVLLRFLFQKKRKVAVSFWYCIWQKCWCSRLMISSINQSSPSSSRFYTVFLLCREVLAAEELLNMPERVDWKACKVSKETEIKMAVDFRNRFSPFDFTLLWFVIFCIDLILPILLFGSEIWVPFLNLGHKYWDKCDIEKHIP